MVQKLSNKQATVYNSLHQTIWHALRLNIRASTVSNIYNHDLCNLVQWLRANRILLIVSKNVIFIVIFKYHSKQITKHLNFHLTSGQKIKPKKTH